MTLPQSKVVDLKTAFGPAKIVDTHNDETSKIPEENFISEPPEDQNTNIKLILSVLLSFTNQKYIKKISL
jgi:hypothetical protein